MRINGSQRPTLGLVTGGKVESGTASSNYGPVRAGLTSSQTTQHQQLSESLNYLEREVEILQSKFLEYLAANQGVVGSNPASYAGRLIRYQHFYPERDLHPDNASQGGQTRVYSSHFSDSVGSFLHRIYCSTFINW